MTTSLSSLLMEYPFVKFEEASAPADMHGIFVIVCCMPLADGSMDCSLLDYGGAVDLRYAVGNSLASNGWEEKYPGGISVMVALVSPFQCETILGQLRSIPRKEPAEPTLH
jgi:hypothetical protein